MLYSQECVLTRQPEEQQETVSAPGSLQQHETSYLDALDGLIEAPPDIFGSPPHG